MNAMDLPWSQDRETAGLVQFQWAMLKTPAYFLPFFSICTTLAQSLLSIDTYSMNKPILQKMKQSLQELNARLGSIISLVLRSEYVFTIRSLVRRRTNSPTISASSQNLPTTLS